MIENGENASNIWRQQLTTGFTLSADEIRRRVNRTKSRVRRRRVIAIATGIIMLISACGVLLFFETAAAVWLRAIQVLCWVVLLTLGPQIYQEHRQLLSLGLVSRPMPCLDFYRRELERQRDSLRPIPWLMVIVSVFGLSLATFATRHRTTIVTLGVLMILIAIAGYARMKWLAPKVQTELDDLSTYQKASSAEP